MVVFFDVGLVCAVIGVIAFICIAAINMGIDGICQAILDNPRETIIICTAVIFIISVLICCIIYFEKSEIINSFLYGIKESVVLTLGLSASTLFNIYITVELIQYLNQTFDLVLQIIFFIVPLMYIGFLIIMYVISYAVGLSAILLRVKVALDSRVSKFSEKIVEVVTFIVPAILYGIVVYSLLSESCTFL